MMKSYSRYALCFCLALALAGCTNRYTTNEDQAVWQNSENDILTCPNGGLKPGCAYRTEEDSSLNQAGNVFSGVPALAVVRSN